MTKLTCQRHLFDLDPEVTYLNMAYQSPLLKSSVDAGIIGLKRKMRPNTIKGEDFFEPLEEVKSLFGSLIDADPQRIAYHPSVSYGMANVIANLPTPSGGNIVTIQDQFPSNVLGYQKFARQHGVELRSVPAPEAWHNRSQIWTDRILESIDQKTICVSIPQVHWSDGSVLDLINIGQQCKRQNALLIIDGTQSIGVFPFSVKEIQPDAVVAACYKFLLGPYGSALAYYGPAFDDGQPIEDSWMNRLNSNQFDQLSQYEQQYRPKAYRFNVGECANFVFLPMLADALRQTEAWGVLEIAQYLAQLRTRFEHLFSQYDLNFEHKGKSGHLFGVQSGSSSEKLYKHLTSSQIHVSLRGKMMRFSPYLYNEAVELEAVESALSSYHSS